MNLIKSLVPHNKAIYQIMNKYTKGKVNLYLGDCMEFMAKVPDNYYDLAVVDPPYFSGPEKRKYYGNKIGKSKHSKTGSKCIIKRTEYSIGKKWNVPDESYFSQLKRISKNQIVWGVNYYDYVLGSGRIIWDKVNSKSSFSDAEIAYCSIHDSVRIVKYMWNGMMQGKSIKEGDLQQGNKKLNEKRIHPTQKPVKLYDWIFHNYAKPGMKVLDTHGGSMSSAIAAYYFGCEFDCIEKDEDYYNDAVRRFKEQTMQAKTNFSKKVEQTIIQKEIFKT